LQEEEERKRREQEEELRRLENERRAALSHELEANYFIMEKERNDLLAEVIMLRDLNMSSQQTIQRLTTQKNELNSKCDDFEDRLAVEELKSADLNSKKKKLELETTDLNRIIDEIQPRLNLIEAELKLKYNENQELQNNLGQQEDLINKLIKEKKRLEELSHKLTEHLHQEEDKNKQLNKTKLSLHQNLIILEENIESERKEKNDLERMLRKLESELKLSQSSCTGWWPIRYYLIVLIFN
jgi:hypothetical protein